ncbi:hypothetical protein NLM16_08960 [Bradyrhizobium brasilense]|uniref:hypothetical protein n=1 Tax=Bradyrhizobium brasilense TaxID=1419277 RepID=UPI002877E188|nr:hypothetical protein [Bradyrhizobium brasilense]MCP3414228.1 hypothetical protein [Bradyrhizobium brasilense]
MIHDISGAILSHVSNFAVGLVKREHGKGSTVLGSGVLTSVEGRHGILTCGHVAETYEKLPEIGIIRFVAEGNQRRLIRLEDTTTMIIQSSDSFAEDKEVLDLAFTALPPNVASSIEAHGGVFLNIEKNRQKMEALAQSEGKHADAMIGLVAEFSQEPFIEGREVISPMRGVLHSGHISAQENGLLTFNAMEYNLHELPKRFGGMSGGGVWRVYIEGENEPKIVATMLCGIASWQIDDRKIACQGWDRIDQALVPIVREKIQPG